MTFPTLLRHLFFLLLPAASWVASAQPTAGEPSLRESVLLRTDKTFYLAGETIWFAADVVHTGTTLPSGFSKAVYVELFDVTDRAVLQATVGVRGGNGDGWLRLPTSLPTGMYRLRAYTAWMKNAGAARFFQRALSIVNTARRPNWAALEQAPDARVSFYPEGGRCVAGLQNRIGFRLLDNHGRGVDGEGAVLDGSDTVIRFRTHRFGLGRFDWQPQPQRSYKVLVRPAGGQWKEEKLPNVETEGVTLLLEPEHETLVLRVQARSVSTNETLLLNGRQAPVANQPIGNGVMEWKWRLRVDSLREGLNQMAVTNTAGVVLAERLFFKRPASRQSLLVVPNKKRYTQRERVDVELQARNALDLPLNAAVSVSVFLLDSFQRDEASLVDEGFALTSVIGGPSAPAVFALSDANAQGDMVLDNLLLTHPAKAEESALSFLPDYEGPIIQARIMHRGSGQPLANRLCYLSVPGRYFSVSNAVSDEQGWLRFVVKNAYGPVDLVLQTAEGDSNAIFEVTSPYSTEKPFWPAPSLTLPAAWEEQLANRHLNAQLLSAFAQETRAAVLQNQTDTLAFYGEPDRRYWLDEYTRFPTMEEVMREFVAEVQLQKNRDAFSYRVFNRPYAIYFDAPPLVLLDGVPVPDAGRILAYDPLKVQRIDVVARKYYWGNLVCNGIISYTTYEGGLPAFELQSGTALIAYNAQQAKREFWSPSYETAAARQSREPDRRNVLFWSPAVALQQGRAGITFHTGDVPGRYAIRVQGFNASGEAVSSVAVIEVE